MFINKKKLLFIPALLVGVVAIIIAVSGRKPPEKAPPAEKVTQVRVIEAKETTVVPRAIAYGVVQPGTVWNAVAETGGPIIETHPQLKRGAIIRAGEVLFRIDPAPYQLLVAQTEANIQAAEAKLAELEVREQNTRAALAIEERGLALARRDLDRQKELLTKKTVAQAVVDREERNLLAVQSAVQAQRNTLNLIPAERRNLEAELAVNRSRLEDARLNLERTVILAPFDCRVAEVRAEAGQYAGPGQILAIVDSIGLAEVSAQLAIDRMMTIVTASRDRAEDGDEFVPQAMGIEPVVRLRAGDMLVEWPARLSRISDAMDPETRTVGVIVAVDEPYRHVSPGYRPPLVKNMFVEVELRGRSREGLIVVPRSALRNGSVFVVGPEGRLEKRPVEILFRQTNFAAVKSGLEPGEMVVISDLLPAVEGMLLAPTVDNAAAEALALEAGGRGTIR